MKVKLLKKVRKRFKILYLYNKHCLELWDSAYPFNSARNVVKIDDSKKDGQTFDAALNALKTMTLIIVKAKYSSLGSKRKKLNENKQIWP